MPQRLHVRKHVCLVTNESPFFLMIKWLNRDAKMISTNLELYCCFNICQNNVLFWWYPASLTKHPSNEYFFYCDTLNILVYNKIRLSIERLRFFFTVSLHFFFFFLRLNNESQNCCQDPGLQTKPSECIMNWCRGGDGVTLLFKALCDFLPPTHVGFFSRLWSALFLLLYGARQHLHDNNLVIILR